jgi:hypothetical protein
VTVRVEKNLWNFWEVLSSSQAWTKKNASTAAFSVPLKANEVVTLKLKVRFTQR